MSRFNDEIAVCSVTRNFSWAQVVKVKSNREVDMINKWREVDGAHEDLEHIRVAHLKKLKLFEV